MPDVVATRRNRLVAALFWLLVVSAAVLATGNDASAQTGLSGIDVSNWQRQIDWVAVAGTGNSFVFAKATESTTFTDLTFPLNRPGSTVLGMRFGAYHMGRPSGSTDAAVVASAIAQADFFLSVASPLKGELLPVLDVEYDGGLSVPRLSLWVQTWLGQVVARTGLKPIVYVSPSFWKTRLGDSPVVAAAGHRLWIAHWTKAALPILPGASWGGLGWSFWQWSNCQKIDGINGCVDGDRFNGSSLAGVTVPSYPGGAPTLATTPTIVGGPQAGKLLAAVPGTWRGGKPLSFAYQWQRCDAAGRGCAGISGAVGRVYTPNADDVGHALLVRVSAVTPAGTAAASSAPTLAAAASGATGGAAPKVQKLPTVQGGSQVGQVLTAQVGTWTGSPTSYSYQWRRCPTGGAACVAIAGAGGIAYTTSPGDIGSVISLTVTAIGKGGAASATAKPTTTILAAPIPAPAVENTIVQAGQAGAVTTVTGVASATWQPGTLPNLAAVGLVDATSHLSLKGTSVRLSFGAVAPLPWPIDVQYPAAPADAVPGILPLQGVWQPLAELPTPILPPAQQAGTYRDAAGTLHLLTRTAGRIALFAVGKWGDPRYATALKPRVALVNKVKKTTTADGSIVVYGRITLDTQAHLYVTLAAANGTKLLLTQKGSRVGWWLQGNPAKTLQALQLQPGALPVRLRVRAAQLRAKGPHTLRIVALDPYGRKSALAVKIG
jgi:GH25 family lysozyme M1 (1,4-beta-N-acetylmuramidase)